MKHIIALILLVLTTHYPVAAQESIPVYQGIVSIKQQTAEIKEDSIVWDMDVYIQGITIRRYQSMLLTPVIYSDTDSLALAPIILNGKDKQRITTRKMILANKIKEDAAYAIVGNDMVNMLTVPYHCKFAYKDWMAHAGFRLIGQLCDFDGKPIKTFVDVLSDDLKLRREEAAIRPDTIFVKRQK